MPMTSREQATQIRIPGLHLLGNNLGDRTCIWLWLMHVAKPVRPLQQCNNKAAVAGVTIQNPSHTNFSWWTFQTKFHLKRLKSDMTSTSTSFGAQLASHTSKTSRRSQSKLVQKLASNSCCEDQTAHDLPSNMYVLLFMFCRTRARFDPREQAKGMKTRNEEAQEAAKKFAEQLLSGGLNPDSQDFNQGEGSSGSK